MGRSLSKRELVAVAERLLHDHNLPPNEKDKLIDEFEANTYPQACELVFDWRHKFKDLPDLVDFARGEGKQVKKLSREELIAVTRRLLEDDFTLDGAGDVDRSRLCQQFRVSVPHPGGTDLIYWPKIEFKAAEELVDYALSYKPPKE